MTRGWSPAACETAQERAAAAVDGPLSYQAYRDWRAAASGYYPSGSAVRDTLGDGRWRDALDAAELGDRAGAWRGGGERRWTEAAVREALANVPVADLTAADYRELARGRDDLPTLPTLRQYASWSALPDWLDAE